MAIHGKRTLKALQEGIDNGTPFKAASVSGTADPSSYTGRLPEPYASQYLNAYHAGRIVYVVLSYATPIAWKLDDGQWVQPDARYSATTSGHQSRVAVAIAHKGFWMP
jgi:hypothetical protein